MNFGEAIRTCLTKYVDFSGRARRSEYWWFGLFCSLVNLVAGGLDMILRLAYAGPDSEVHYGNGPISIVVSLALFLPSLAAVVRRLHDTGRSGWWYLLSLIPCVGIIVLIVFMVQDSHPDNQYGPSPKYPSSPTVPPYGGTWR